MAAMATTSATAAAGAAGARQRFSGADDVVLLRLVERAAPWSQRRGVMEAWQKVANALNMEAASSLTNVSAPAARARFFRLVAQRRERQEAALRRTSATDEQHAEKVELLDRLIARLDAHDDETALQDLLGRVDTDAVGLQDAQVVPETLMQLSARDKSVPVLGAQPPSQILGTNQEMNFTTPHVSIGVAREQPVLTTDESKHRLVQNTPSFLDKRTQSHSMRSVTPDKTPLPPAKRVRTESPQLMGAQPASSGTLEGIAKGLIARLEQKLQCDRQEAQVERDLRRQEMRLFANEMKATREHMTKLLQQLIQIAAFRA